jgi:MATE family multidrug resistance protein
MGVFLLRSYKVTLMPLVVYTLFLWGVGLCGGYYLAYGHQSETFMQNPSAFWFAAVVSLVFVSGWFSVSLLRISRKSIK